MMKKIVYIVILFVMFVSLFGTQTVVSADDGTDGYLPIDIVGNECQIGHEKQGGCKTLFKAESGVCKQNTFPIHAVAFGWHDYSVCAIPQPVPSEPPAPTPSDPPAPEKEVVAVEVPQTLINYCLDSMTVSLTVTKMINGEEQKDVMLINLESGEKRIVTKNLSGDFSQGTFKDGTCPSIFAVTKLPGEKYTDIVQISDLYAYSPTVLPATFTKFSDESYPDYGFGKLYYTRGSLTFSIYSQEYNGAAPVREVSVGKNSNFNVTIEGSEVLAYEYGDSNLIYVNVDGTQSQKRLLTGKNPVVDNLGRIFYSSDGYLAYYDGFEEKITDIVASEVSFSSDGGWAVIVAEGEAFLYIVEDYGLINGIGLPQIQKLTDLSVDGVVSDPDIYTPPN